MKHTSLIRIPKVALENAVRLPFVAYGKALSGAVARAVLTQAEALEIIEDANLHVLEGSSQIGAQVDEQ